MTPWNLNMAGWRPILLSAFLLWLPLMLEAQSTATPRKGEGVGEFLERHGLPSKTYLREFLRLNSRKLGKGQTLRMGESYLLPPLAGTPAEASGSASGEAPASSEGKKSGGGTGTVLREPLFGKSQEKVRMTGQSLRGACFYIVSGHGGPDPGAIGVMGKYRLHEDEYAYDVALRLARELMAEGATVRIIIQDKGDGIRDDQILSTGNRETCMGKKIPLNQVERLRQRTRKINSLYASDRKSYSYLRAVFIHVDSRSKGERTDVFFLYNPSQAAGKRLAEGMRATFEEKYRQHQPDRGFSGTVETRNLYVLANTTPTCLFVELGNIQNTLDQKRFILSSNRQALANWMCQGLARDFKISKGLK